MYSLTFCVRVVARMPTLEARSPGRNSNVENAHRRQPATGQPATPTFHIRRRAILRTPPPRHPPVTGQQHAHHYSSHYVETRAPIANPPNSAQLGDIPYHSPKLHPVPCNSVGILPRTDTQTHKQTQTQTRVTTIHFASSTTHAKCNDRRGACEHRGNCLRPEYRYDTL